MRLFAAALLFSCIVNGQSRLTYPVTVLPKADNSAPGEILVQNKINSAPIGVFSWADAWNVKNYPYYCAGDGTTDDTTCITNAINSNRALIFPEGIYKVHNNPDPLSFTGWTGSIHFEGNAQILCDNPDQGCFLFTGGSNQVLEDVSYTYGATEPTDQCPDHGGMGNCWGWAFYGTQNTTVRNFNVNNGYGIGLLFIGGCAGVGMAGCGTVPEPTLHCIHPQILGARITNISRDGLNIQNCSEAVVSSVYAENTGDDTFGFQYSTDRWQDTGMKADNLYSFYSLGGCISDSQQNTVISGFVCDHPSTGGLLISYPGFLLNPFSGTISNGVIRDVNFRTGGICNCGARGIDFFNAVDTAFFDNISIERTGGSGIIMETFMETPPIAPFVRFSNITVKDTGYPMNADGAGHCFFLQAATTVVSQNLHGENCAGWGLAYDSVTNAYSSGVTIANADTDSVSYVSNQAITFTNNTNVDVSNMSIWDTQSSATGYIFAESGTTGVATIDGIQAYIQHGTYQFNVSSAAKFWNSIDRSSGTNYSNSNYSGYGSAPLGFSSAIDVTDPGAANLVAAHSGSASTSTAAIVVGNGSIHHQAAFGLFEGNPNSGGTLKWSLGHFEDNNPSTPDGFFLFDGKNGLDTFFVDPNATACSACGGKTTRIQFQPSGGMFWAGLPFYSTNAAAITGGLLVNDMYQDRSGIVRIVASSVTPIGGGTVTSVAQSFTGGLISVGGSPITTAGTFALTVAGTSGGIPYFSSSSTWASSALLTANRPVIGGGAGASPSVGTVSGNTTEFVTTSGTQTAGDCVGIDFNGNHVDAGHPCNLGTVTNVGSTSPINSTGGSTPNISCTTCVIGASGRKAIGSLSSFNGSGARSIATGLSSIDSIVCSLAQGGTPTEFCSFDSPSGGTITAHSSNAISSANFYWFAMGPP